MSWSLALNIGEAFAEAVLRRENQTIEKRWFLPGLQFSRALTEWLTEQKADQLQKVYLATSWAQTILDRRLSGAPTMLVTSGFESWLEINSRVTKKGLSFNPERQSPLTEKDHILGIRERTYSDGTVEVEPNDEDLEFLASKLEMMKARFVAIGFLHANKNANNENKVAAFLRSKNFTVFTSDPKSQDSEIVRWNAVLKRAYIAESYQPLITGLIEIAKNFGCQEDNFLIHGETGFAKAAQPHDSLATIPGPHSAIKNYVQRKFGDRPFTYFSFDEFFDSKDGTLPLHPLQTLTSGAFGVVTLDEKCIQYETGPMGWGRGVQGTILDLLWQKNAADFPVEIGGRFTERGAKRMGETLLTLSRPLVNEERPTSETLTHVLFSEIKDRLKELNHRIALGPLAKGFFHLLPDNGTIETGAHGFEACYGLLEGLKE